MLSALDGNGVRFFDSTPFIQKWVNKHLPEKNKISEDWFLEFWTPGKVYTVVCVFAW